MQWSEVIEKYLASLSPVEINESLLKKITSLIDLTSLNEQDTTESISSLCKKAQTSYGAVAAVCVYPRFVPLVTTELSGTEIKVASVANFPAGEAPLESVLHEIADALDAGANEIDVVFPYSRYLAGERQYAHTFVTACKMACGNVTLKMILETGALNDPAIIADASLDALASGADFIKTSTGKTHAGATLEAAVTMLLVIKHATPHLKRALGFKVSGGIKDLKQAAQYLDLADHIMGHDWATPKTFRIGSSKLVDEIISFKA